MKLFTVDRESTLYSGQVLELIKDDPNVHPYWEIPNLVTSNDLREHLQALFPEGLSIFGWGYLKYRHTYGKNPNLKHYTSYLIEMNLEYVRKGFFDKQHSRFQSIFACGSVEDAFRFRTLYGKSQDKIYEIEYDAFHKHDMSIILLGTQNIAGSYLAHKYWKGEAGENLFWEYIVKLPIKVGLQVP